MNRHTDQLYRLAELPAFIEEALSNVSLKGIIEIYQFGDGDMLIGAMGESVIAYAEEWVDNWIKRYANLWVDKEDEQDQEIRAIEAGVKLFSNPDCKAGLPE